MTRIFTCCGGGEYNIQFETDNPKAYETVQEVCRLYIDREKQTPKKPNKIGYPFDSDIDPLVYGYCPCCDTHRDSSKKYCDECGQALDWSDTE